ncbi:MAG: hypothetical protein GTO17_06305 [Candidatus Aminicenantes bacterium]|nr:hypothetical protein [Candidatus Aminicenantes bacterium]
MKKIALSSKEKTPKRWGRWILDEGNLSLFTNYDNDKKRYCIPLVLCNNPKSTLDWIASIYEKEWTTNLDIGDLVEALDDLLNLKSAFDRNGNEHENGNIICTKNAVQKRVRLSKIKIINKGG